jgi:hypothetical protein
VIFVSNFGHQKVTVFDPRVLENSIKANPKFSYSPLISPKIKGQYLPG